MADLDTKIDIYPQSMCMIFLVNVWYMLREWPLHVNFIEIVLCRNINIKYKKQLLVKSYRCSDVLRDSSQIEVIWVSGKITCNIIYNNCQKLQWKKSSNAKFRLKGIHMLFTSAEYRPLCRGLLCSGTSWKGIANERSSGSWVIPVAIGMLSISGNDHDDFIKWKHFLCYRPFVTGEFPSQRPVTRDFDVFLDLHLNKPKIIVTPIVWDAIELIMTSL